MEKGLLKHFSALNSAAELIGKTQRQHFKIFQQSPSAIGAALERDKLDLAKFASFGTLKGQIDSLMGSQSGLNAALHQLESQRIVPRLQAAADHAEAKFRAADALAHFNGESAVLRLAREKVELFGMGYTLPESSALQRYLEDFRSQQLAYAPASQTLLPDFSAVKRAMELMRSPWLNDNNVLGSIGSVIDFQRLAHTIGHQSPFSRDTSTLVRSALGDWREAITLPRDRFLEATERANLYIEKGFNPGLAEFPEAAFDELVETTGLDAESNAVFNLFEMSNPMDDRVLPDRASLTRAELAFGRLLRLEIYLRRFIDDAMTREFGPNWPRLRLPAEIYNRWVEKREKAKTSDGTDMPLIEYADFTDYHRIIRGKDNWAKVFQSLFGRQADVLESLQRLMPLRIAACHARPTIITNDDLMMLNVESMRIVRVTRIYMERL